MKTFISNGNTFEISGSVMVTELLPFEEKADPIVELRKERRYKEIRKALKVSLRDIKRALKLFSKTVYIIAHPPPAIIAPEDAFNSLT